ncbi:M14 family metallopeptidase [Flavihumibacter rivuli]|uniref:M14 family metallopeptidase n=1 Tax=Flavihumibacter rivuli TaxID=2838156 RepID=UPI001BDF2FF2|nr:M14 family metallopeptidase [Flavihumibacter rivuli]ULQ58199.1 M14 family metallopeptidase [Flavihumibacter rivuli]
MKHVLGLALSLTLFYHSQAQPLPTVFEKTGGRETATYQEVISYYQQLDKQSNRLKLTTMGMTDAGFPLHLALFSNDGSADPALWHRQNKVVILINNGIHPGEPDGIDASMMLLRDLVTGRKSIPNNVALAFIPVYNIGGCLNRSAYYRVDQDGPDAFGSRGNSQNLDLNRDFIKCDSREARSFTGIYHFTNPDVFIDNHVSNGADYQHIMTLIASQHNKLGGKMGEFMNKQFEPGLYSLMKARGYDLIPYVNAFGDTPESGWPEFLEGPRYSSGYASLWNSFAFVPETHMLKPYKQRVDATYQLMECFVQFASTNATTIKQLRKETIAENLRKTRFPIDWSLDKEQYTERTFKGFEAGKKPSGVSGLPRLYYDRSKPFEKKVKFYNTYKASLEVERPEAYIIPQGWWKVIDLLATNKVEMQQIRKDTIMALEVYRIADYKSIQRPFESHHLNTEVKVTKQTEQVRLRKGDWYIPMNQPANRFLVEVLEPQADDSYFAWNFFDGILGQKEGYSSYVFEDTAEEFLKQNPEVRKKLEERKATDSSFAKSAAMQLDFVYKHSPYYEPDHNKYPVYRLPSQH